MKLLAGSTIFALVATAGAARADTKPAWCSTPGLKGQTTLTFDPKEEASDQLYELEVDLCEDHDNADWIENHAKWEAGRAALMKRLDLGDAEWNDAAVWASEEQSTRNAPSLRAPDKKAWSAYSAIDQYEAIGGAFEQDNADYLTDALGAKLTETGKMAFIELCMRGKDEELAVRWAMCAADVASFDPKKVQAELRADTSYDGGIKTMIRLRLAALKDQLPKHAQDVKALIAKDDGYAKMFAIADAARKDWDAKAAARQPLLDLELAMDDAAVTKSRKALAGCEDATWKAWVAAVSAIPAKKWEHMHDDPENGKSFADDAIGPIENDPDGYLAAAALYRCHADDKERDFLVRSLGDALGYWPGFRGPRTATQTGILTAGIVLDDKDARIEYPSVSREFGRNGGSSGGGQGKITSAKTAGGKVHVVFAAKMEKQEECTDERRSNRVTRIRSDGSLEYESTCYASKMVSIDRRSDPRDVDARFAAGLKGGVIVSITEDVVNGVWAKEGASVPSVVFGAPVK